MPDITLKRLLSDPQDTTADTSIAYDKIQAAINAGLTPTFPVTAPRFPLSVYNRGWWGGGIVNVFGLSGKAQIQTIKVIGNGKAGTNVTAGTGALLYTVTAGKTLYVTSLNIQTGILGAAEVRDGTSLSGTLIGAVLGQVTGTEMSGPVPIAFTSGIFIDVAANQTVYYLIIGWEE